MPHKSGDKVQIKGINYVYGDNGELTLLSSVEPTPVKDNKVLSELERKANLNERQPVVVSKLPLPDGSANEQTQSEISLLTKTLNELSARLAVLAGMANSGQPALRTIPIASVSTPVTGTLTGVTTVGTITNFGTGVPAKEMSDDMNNLVVTIANINNVSL